MYVNKRNKARGNRERMRKQMKIMILGSVEIVEIVIKRQCLE
jgi:hypothetical protein